MAVEAIDGFAARGDDAGAVDAQSLTLLDETVVTVEGNGELRSVHRVAYKILGTAGFGVKKNEPRLMDLVNRILLDLEASGEAAKIFDAWFAPLARPFRFAPD